MVSKPTNKNIRSEKLKLEKRISKLEKENEMMKKGSFSGDPILPVKKDKERALIDQVRILHLLTENNKDFISINDKNGRYLYISSLPGYYDRRRIIGRKPEEVFEKIYATKFKNRIKAVISSRKSSTNEISLNLKTDTFWFSELLQPLHDNEGKIIGVVNLSRNITEFKKTKDKLKESEEKFEIMTSNLPVGVYRTDKEGKILYANPALVKILEYKSLEELKKAKSVNFFVNPDFRANQLEQWKSKGNVVSNQIRLKTGKGHYIWVQDTGRIICREDGEIDYLDGIIEDITAKKEKEKPDSDNEILLRNIFETIKAGILVLDINFRITFWNQAMELITNVSREEIMKQNKLPWEIFPDLKRAGIDKIMIRAMQGEEIKDINYHYKHKDGTTGITSEHYYPLMTATGNIKGIIGIIREITEEKKAEEILKISEEKYRTLSENLNVGVYRNTIGKDGTFIEANPALVKIFGYTSKQELMKKRISELYQNVNDRKEFVKKMLEDGFVRKEEIRLLKKDGTKFWGAVTAVTVKDEQGDAKYFDGIIEDISEQKKNEIIKDVLFNISNAISQTSGLTELFQIIHSQVFRLMDAKNFYVALVKDKQKGLYTFPYFVDINPEDLSVPNKIYDLSDGCTHYVIKNEKPLLTNKTKFHDMINRGEFKLIGTDSESWLGVPLKTTGNDIIGVVVTQSYDNPNAYSINDLEVLSIISSTITAAIVNKQAEKSLIKEKERVEEADKLKSAFLSNMSHEIRTPMNSILGFTELLSKKNFSEEQKNKFIDLIQNSGKILLNLVNDIVDIAKIEAGELTINPEELQVNKTLDDIFLFFNENKNITNYENISLELKKGVKNQDFTIKADSNRLNQVLNNLINNAFKFTDKGSIELGYTIESTDKSDTKDNYLLFYVKDTGIGIPLNQQKHIFRRFGQVENHKNSKIGGTGLGLPISKGLIELMGGEMWLESKSKKGSIFYFTIPLIISENVKPKKAIKQKSGKKDFRDKLVLVAEDNDYNYSYIEELMVDAGIEIIRAVDGQEAVEKCKTIPEIDLVLMDIKMPRKNGYIATKEIKSIRKDIPVIAQTAFAMAGEKEKSHEAGCDAHINKPIKKEELFDLISKFLV